MLLAVTGVGGLLMPAWMDLIGRAIPVTMRGRFFAVSSVAASLLGLGASAATADVLATHRPAVAYALCFVCGFMCLIVSFVALVLVREPLAAAARPREPLGAYLRRMPALLREDRNLTWYLVARSLSAVGGAGAAFYTVYALHAWRLPAASAGVFTALLMAGTIAGTTVLGWLADHAGHRLVLLAGVAASVAANATALAATSPQMFGVVFVLTGIQTAAVTISGLNVLLEFAPATEAQPTYVGLGHTSVAPVSFVAPLAAGLLA